MSDELDRLAAEQGINPVQDFEQFRAVQGLTDEEFEAYLAAVRSCREPDE